MSFWNPEMGTAALLLFQDWSLRCISSHCKITKFQSLLSLFLLRAYNHQIADQRNINVNLVFKLSYLNSNFALSQGYRNPLSPNIYIQILQTDLYTFPYWISWESLKNDRRIFLLVIILSILMTSSLDCVLITLGENWCLSLPWRLWTRPRPLRRREARRREHLIEEC